MDDLISRKALIKELQEISTLEAISDHTGDMMFWVDKKAVYKVIKKLPTIKPQGIDKDRLIEEMERVSDKISMIWNGCFGSAVQEVINQQPTTDGWIPCRSGQMPEELEPVNITWVNRNPESYYKQIKDVPFTGTGIFYNGEWWWYSAYCVDYLAEYGENQADAMDKNIEVIAWQPLPQPLPQPYKESENNG